MSLWDVISNALILVEKNRSGSVAAAAGQTAHVLGVLGPVRSQLGSQPDGSAQPNESGTRTSSLRSTDLGSLQGSCSRSGSFTQLRFFVETRGLDAEYWNCP